MPSGHILDDLIKEKSFVPPSAVMIRSECFETVGPFDESLPTSIDYDMWLRIAERFEFEYIDEPLLNYRVYAAQLSKNWQLQIDGREAIFAKYEKYFNERTSYNAKKYLELGILYCMNDDLKIGRKMFRRAMSVYPYGIKSPAAYCMTFLGAGNFQRFIKRMN